jgi:hypothetical protein
MVLRKPIMNQPIDIANRVEPFFDDCLVETLQGVRFELHQPERGEVAFACDAPWEDDVAGFNSVFQDGNKVRLYYRASIPDRSNEDLVVTALAESIDGGYSFQRPDLGLVAFNGSKANNILYIGEPPFVPPPAFIDTNPGCKPGERYKGLSSRWQKLYAMCSADGLHWRPLTEEPLEMEGTFDTINTAFWDGQAGSYRCYTRYFEHFTPETTADDVLGAQPAVVRAIQSATSADFIHWSPVVHNRYDDSYEDMQLYTNAALPCPGAEHIYLSFPNRYVQERTLFPSHGIPGINDALFMVSRNGQDWVRYPEAWVRPGMDELNWTDRNNYPTWGIVQTSPTEWSMYVSEHYRHPGTPTRLRRLAVRPHGFVSLRAGYAGGEVVTRALTFEGSQLRMNYSTSAAGMIKVEIQDAGGSPVEGYTLEDAQPVYGDQLDAGVGWKDTADVSSLAGKAVRLRFVIQDADLFAIRFI